MGRSQGGLTTRIHLLVDADGLPIHLKLTEGQAHDGRSADDIFDTVGDGTILLADRAFDSNERREMLAAKGAFADTSALSQHATTGEPTTSSHRSSSHSSEFG